MKKLSLKIRLILSFILIATTVFCVAGIFAWKETTEKADEFFDTYQMILARQLAGANWNGITPEQQQMTNKLLDDIHSADDEDEAIGFAVFRTDGQMIFNDGENGRDFTYQPVPKSFVNQTVDDEEWRIIWIPAVDSNYMIAVGQEKEYRADIAWEMMEEFTLPWLIGIGMMLLLMIIIIGYEFHPINRLARGLKKRKEDDLSALSEERIPTEILPLIQAMNELLAKVRDTLERERSFIADSAHELRTPLTALKVQLEVLQLMQDDEKARAEGLKKLAQGIDRATRLVEQLLALSRAESGVLADKDTCIPWGQIVQEIRADYQARAKEREINLCIESDNTGPFACGNPVLAATVVRNLTDNAVRYGQAGAEIMITLKNGVLHVLNKQTHVSEDVLTRLGQRFYRPAGQKQKGSGLGLSIVARIVHLYSGKLTFQNTDEGFLVSVYPSDCRFD